MSFFVDLDHKIFLALHGHHSSLMDRVMWYMSEKWIWVPVYAMLLFLLYKKYPGKIFLLVIIMIALSVAINDQLASGLFKDWICRLRPSHDPALEGMIQYVQEPNGQLYRGGLYGFYSSHAANYAGVVTLFILLMRPVRKLWIVLLILWVALISYSRIYLGVHFPGDVLMGWFMGIIVGNLCFLAFKFFKRITGAE